MILESCTDTAMGAFQLNRYFISRDGKASGKAG
jgi:hypothetical protein